MKMMLCIALGHEQCGSSLSACGKVWSILVAVIHCNPLPNTCVLGGYIFLCIIQVRAAR